MSLLCLNIGIKILYDAKMERPFGSLVYILCSTKVFICLPYDLALLDFTCSFIVTNSLNYVYYIVPFVVFLLI